MSRSVFSFLSVAWVVFLVGPAWSWAAPVFIRWTGAEDSNGELQNVLSRLSARAGFELKSKDFLTQDDRPLAYSHYRRLMQVHQGLPVSGLALRIWTDRISGAVIQVEAQIQNPAEISTGNGTQAHVLSKRMTDAETLKLARQAIRFSKLTDDRATGAPTWTDLWSDGEPVRHVVLRGRRGKHHVQISLISGLTVRQWYEEFPQADIPAQAFPIYERVESTGQVLTREPVTLKYLDTNLRRPTSDPYAPLRWRRYLEEQYDPILGESELGRAEGYWAMSYLKRQASQLLLSVPWQPNTFESGSVLLSGQYATINLHPAAVEKFGGQLAFKPGYSSQLRPDWREVNVEGEATYEMVPTAARFGKPLLSLQEAWDRPARIDPNQNPVTYINDGFDEIQVYYAVNQLFDTLRPMGFLDPDLAERPFHAFLFDPDVSMRDNAYYTDDTINFTTYSPGSQNMARDNPTIWHELGHGIMDRLMGDGLELADTGGLSEGMADFLAQLVVQAVTQGQPFPGSAEFRIINRTGFFLTNEVHDDGEAYGGAMNDLLELALGKYGRTGLTMVADAVLEGMRLCRDHPHLTAKDWFEHLLFADELGRPGVREPGQLKSLIVAAIEGRNFSLTSLDHADFQILRKDTKEVLDSQGPGSRGLPIAIELKDKETATFELSAQLVDSSHYQFKYPVQVEVAFTGGALQGAIRWENEEQGPQVHVLKSPADVAQIKLVATAQCDFSNREDGSCVDYAYLKVLNQGEAQPVGKKRFYLRLTPTN